MSSSPIALLIARAKKLSSKNHPAMSRELLVARAHANKNKKSRLLSAREMEFLRSEWEYQDEHKKGPLPRPTGVHRHLLKDVKEVFIAGGGGGGRALPRAVNEAAAFGLDLRKVNVVCASSVGTIVGLAITIGIAAHRMGKILNDMPTDTFQDWSLRSILNSFTNWGWCQGDAMPNYFKRLIKDTTGLEDPTFLELYRAGYRKEFRVVTTNVSQQKVAIFSYKKTPHVKVSKAVGLACSIPLVFPPQWYKNEKGELEAYTDGGLAKNYPWGVGSSPRVQLNEQLGFIIINKHAVQQRPQRNPLVSFWHYLRGLMSMLIFQDPLCLAANVQERTIAVTVNHNPLNFNATKSEQKALDDAGQIAVRRFARQMIKKSQTIVRVPKLLSAFEAKRKQRTIAAQEIVCPLVRRKRRP
jgi:predicted acylesterase/phospholipase RssA